MVQNSRITWVSSCFLFSPTKTTVKDSSSPSTTVASYWPVPPPQPSPFTRTRQPAIAGSVEGAAAGLAILTGTDFLLARFGKGGAT